MKEFIDKVKEVCTPGYVYKDAYGRETEYKGAGSSQVSKSNDRNMIEEITQEVLKQLK